MMQPLLHVQTVQMSFSIRGHGRHQQARHRYGVHPGLDTRHRLQCHAEMQQPAEGSLPPELTRARHIKRAGIVFSGLMLLGGGMTAGLSGLLQPPPAPVLWTIAAITSTAPVALATTKAVLGDSLHVEWHDSQLHVEYAYISNSAAKPTIEVRPTTDGRGNGAFATCKIAKGAHIGQYEGQLLDEAQYWKQYPSGMSDYCIRIDNQWTIDGAERAQDTSAFSACHMNHAGGNASNVARLTFRKQKAVRFFAKRDIEAGEELLLDYGAVYWTGREDLIV